MSTVKRAADGTITHVLHHYYNETNFFVTKRDYDTLKTHEITPDEVLNWLGGDNESTESLSIIIAELASGKYPMDQFRYDIITYADGLLLDGILIERA